MLQSTSCYAIPAFDVMELANRGAMAAALNTAKLARPADGDPYWPEAELGVQQTPADRLTVSHVNDGIEYRLKEEEVRMAGSAGQLRNDESVRVARYFARHWPLHPQPRRDLKAGSNLPARLEIETATLSARHLEILTISNARRGKVNFPLPAGLASSLRTVSGDGPMQRGLHQSLLATDGRSTIPRPTLQALTAAMREAAAHSRSVEVMLLFLNITQQYQSALLNGPDHQAMIAEIGPLVRAAMSDPTTAMLRQAQDLAGNPQTPGDRQATARYLAGAATLDQMRFGTFRYVTFANLVRVSPGSSKWDPTIFKLMPSPLVDNYWIHIAAYPWAANAYKDAGDTYLYSYDAADAWLAYDLGRTVDKDSQGGVMATLAAYEQRLRVMLPDFF